ncbi:MAG: DUF4142 domain-containing protein [Burkholderiales bacterium]|nr:DUF4142 domain-containing protein [Burkholderiales bacterium]
MTNRSTIEKSLLAVALAAAIAPLALAQTTTPTTTTAPAATPAKATHADSAFMKDAAEGGHAEVAASRMALDKASSPQVKAFAQHMVDEHGQVGTELDALAAAKGVKLPSDATLMQKARLKLLGASDGARFDQHYVDGFGVKAHEDAAKLFRKAASNAKDADVRAFAAKTLPTIEQHLRMAKDLEASLSAATKAAPQPKS